LNDLPLIEFVMAIGEPQFAQKGLDYVNSRLPVDHISLFILDHELVPHFLGGASPAADRTALLAGRIYERAMFYRHDPNSQRISKAGAGETMIFRQRASDIRDPQYRDRLYRHFGLLERLSVVRTVAGKWFVFNVYRNVGSGHFNAVELDALAELGPMLVTCTAKHAALAEPDLIDDGTVKSREYLDSLLKSAEPKLTPRERQVCALALADQTVAEIAATLGIGQSTVATLRRRAYAKLGITRLSGLFALCIAKISR
jgi:DNA-binding CsgD family transcriptional regulator